MKIRKAAIAVFLTISLFLGKYPLSALAIGGADVAIVGQAVMDQTLFSQIALMGADASGLTDPIKVQKSPTQTMVEWIQGEFDNWRARQYLTWGTVLTVAANGARYLSDGRILLNAELSDLFQRFYNWLWDGEEGPNLKNDAPVDESGVNEGVVTYPETYDSSVFYYPNIVWSVNYYKSVKWKNSNNNEFEYTTDNDGVIVLTSNAILAFSKSPGNMYYKLNGGNQNVFDLRQATTKTGDVYYYRGQTSFWANPDGFPLCTGYNVVSGNSITSNVYNYHQDIAQCIFGGFGHFIGDDNVIGDPDVLGGLDGQQADTNILAPPDLFNWGPDFGGNGGYIDINDYLGGIADGIENGEGTMDVTKNVEGVDTTEAESFTYDNTADIDVTQELEEDITGDIEDVADQTTVDSLEPYALDLRDFFPFCIPFDLYDLITLFSASPEAPFITYNFYIPNIVDEDIELDFSVFDSVASVMRNAELLAAAIGLALMTKRLIQGGD